MYLHCLIGSIYYQINQAYGPTQTMVKRPIGGPL